MRNAVINYQRKKNNLRQRMRTPRCHSKCRWSCRWCHQQDSSLPHSLYAAFLHKRAVKTKFYHIQRTTVERRRTFVWKVTAEE
jgi:hypothetical protein